MCEAGELLFVSVSRGGLRPTFFGQGKLRFRRLSQLATHSIDEIGRTTTNESTKIFQYLVAQRQVPRGVALRTVVLAHPGQIPALQDYCGSTDDLRFEFIDLAATAHKQGLQDVPGDSNADNLFIHGLASKTPPQQFAPAGETRTHLLWRIRSALTGAAWIVLAGSIVFAGHTLFDVYQLRDATETARALTAADTKRYQDILEGLPKVSITPDNLRLLLGRFDVLQKRTPAIGPLLLHLSLALNDTPKVELTRLAWKTVDQLESGAKSGAGAALPAAAGGEGWAVIEFQAQLPLGLASDKRAQLDMIESFAARLRDPGTDVRVLSRPFDIESDKVLRNPAERREMQVADVPKFAFRVARRL